MTRKIWYAYYAVFYVTLQLLTFFMPDDWTIWLINHTYDETVSGFSCEENGEFMLMLVALSLNAIFICATSWFSSWISRSKASSVAQ
ncbi:hypothetical membrane protein [Pseudomonas knackmussii B13]|uniref:Hypothetical membrane protein n=1 Tax=Pseudomonas knackmussii (strain DSM 6978 / CCUG 54928 / LMG 23759 / B13) TaxID=1301098 RepID=A0A024HIB2_PSEKB|nr:hypothetical protein [Pseudomonas knackmussii]CDF84188.1 hypothetical membrane protein [Pseudomonas knackmussii B13]